MTTIGFDSDSLQAAIQGSVITSADPGYDLARKVWNADHEHRPALIVQCEGAEDVSAVIRCAADAGLEIAVRGGAHSFPGASTCEGGIVIDLRRMNSVDVNPESRRARVGGGVLFGDVDAAPSNRSTRRTHGASTDMTRAYIWPTSPTP